MTVLNEPIFDDPLTQDDLEPTGAARRRAVVEDTFSMLVGPSLYRRAELSEARRWGGMAFPEYTPDEAREWIKGQGLEGHLTPEDRTYNQLELSILARRKQAELKRRYILERAGGGFARGSERLLIALGTSLLDPLTVASAFVPVVSQAKYAALLKGATGALGRAGVRAGVGAIEGAAGAALVEPIVYGAKRAEQADYTLYDSLANITFGGVFGGGLHSVGGAVVDWRTGRRERAVGAARKQFEARLAEMGVELDRDLPLWDQIMQDRFALRFIDDPETMVSDYAALPDSDNGRILSVDTARELSPDYLADRSKSAAVHEPASAFMKFLYRKRLETPARPGQDEVVIFSAGGTGAGKTTGLNALGDLAARAHTIYDTNLGAFKGAVTKIDQALAAGKKVWVVYTYRDPVEALTQGALPRAMRQEQKFGTGRTVPLKEHAATHQGSRETVPKLIEHYRDNPKVGFAIIDNSRGRGQARVVALDELPARDYNSVREELRAALEAEYQAGHISASVYEGFRDRDVQAGHAAARRTVRGEPESKRPEGRQDSLSAADRASAAAPETREAALRGAVAQDLAGDPVNVDPVFEIDPATRTRPLDETLDTLRRGEPPPAEQVVDEIVEAAEATAIEQQIADLEATLKDLNDELALDDAALPDDIRAELDEAAAIAEEADTFAEAARLLAACQMRSST